MFGRRRKRDDSGQIAKMAQSQAILLDAATQAANAAHDVTLRLKSRLEDAIAQYDATLATVHEAIIVTDEHGRIVTCNKAAHDLFDGCETGREVMTLFDAPSSFEGLLSAIEGDVRSMSGIPLEISQTRIDWSDGSHSRLFTIKDVTEIENLKGRVESMEKTLTTIGIPVLDGIIIVSGDRIAATNEASAKILGYSCKTLLDRPAASVFSAADFEIVKNADQKTVLVRAEDHMGRQIDLIVRVSTIQWGDGEAKLLGLNDIERVRRADRRDNAIVMVVCFDANFRITFCNAAFARAHESQRGKLIGKDIRIFVAEDRVSFTKRMETLKESRSTGRRLEQKDEIIDWVESVSYDGDVFDEFVLVGRDVTAIAKKT